MTVATHARMRSRPAARLGLYVAAALGAILLAVVAVDSWPKVYFDGLAYWRAGERLVSGASVYQAGLVGTPLAYWYPPPLAQALAPITTVVPEVVFNWLWITLLVGCLWWLVDGQPLWFLASLVFLPVAVELNVRNIHLPLAVMIVIGLSRRGWSWLLGVGAVIKIAPAVGIVYLAARGRWRDAAWAFGMAAAICVASFLLAPSLWFTWLSTMLANGGVEAGAALVPIPYWVRGVAALALALWAGRQPERIGDPMAAIAVVLALPTWWAPAFATLLAAWKLRPWRGAPVPDPATPGASDGPGDDHRGQSQRQRGGDADGRAEPARERSSAGRAAAGGPEAAGPIIGFQRVIRQRTRPSWIVVAPCVGGGGPVPDPAGTEVNPAVPTK